MALDGIPPHVNTHSAPKKIRAQSTPTSLIGKRTASEVANAHFIYRETLRQLVGDHKPAADGKSAVDYFLRYVAFHAEVEGVLVKVETISPDRLDSYTRDVLEFIAAVDRLTGGLFEGSTGASLALAVPHVG